MKLVCPALEIKNGRLILSQNQISQVKAIARDGWVQVTFAPPFRPRSTGKKSHNHRVNGHVAAIAEATGEDFDVVKIRLKQLAISRGWPFVTVTEEINGVTHEFKIAMSEARASIEQDNVLCDVIEKYAAEHGIALPEGE